MQDMDVKNNISWIKIRIKRTSTKLNKYPLLGSFKYQRNYSYSTQKQKCFNLKLERSQKSNCRLRGVEPVGAHVQRNRERYVQLDIWPAIKAICGTSILFLTIAPIKEERPIRERGLEMCDSRAVSCVG